MEKMGLYVHIPFCSRKCLYCGFNSTTQVELMPQYINALKKEINVISEKYNKVIDTVYFGGGTPSLLEKNQLFEIMDYITKNFNTEFREITIECNPDSISEDKLLYYKNLGINRISIGAQSFCDESLKYLGRIHDSATAKKSACLAKRIFDNVSLDFMLNLKYQEKKDITDFARFVRDIEIPHVSCYGLTLEEGTPLYLAGEDIDEDFTAELYDSCVFELKRNNVERYEISNFAKKGFECLHNLKYWRMHEYLGLGVSAHSYVDGARFQNTDDIKKYLAGNFFHSSAVLKDKDKRFEYIMLNLRLSQGIDLNEFFYIFSNDFLWLYSGVIKKHSSFFDIKNGRIYVNSKGVYVINSLLTDFL